MHDGIHLELAGLPAAVICTEQFTRTGQAMAEVWGAPDYPLILMPHPLSSRTPAELEAVAGELVASVLGRWKAVGSRILYARLPHSAYRLLNNPGPSSPVGYN